MSSIANPQVRPRVLAVPRGQQLTAGDRLLQKAAFLAVILEIVVFIEPAPVDAVIIVCLVAAALAGKLDFSGVGASALAFISMFAVMNLVSVYDAFNPGHAISYVAVTLYLSASWLLFAGLVGRYGKPLMATLILAYCIAGVISALLGAGGYFHLLPFQDRLLLNGRARGLFKDCNVYGPFFVPMALFAFPRLMDTRSPVRQRVRQGVFFASAVLGMLLSFSRACWINFGIAFAILLTGQFLLLPGREKTRGLTGKAGVLLAGALAVMLLLNVPMVHSMLTMRVNSNRLQDYDRVRFATQSLALEAAGTHPFGIGPGQSEEVFDYATHSVYLRILVENGALALAALLAFIGATLARCLTLMRHAADPWIREVNLAVFACICGHLVNSFVIDTVHWRHIWFIYGLPWVSTPLYRYIRKVRAGNPFSTRDSRMTSPALARV